MSITYKAELRTRRGAFKVKTKAPDLGRALGNITRLGNIYHPYFITVVCAGDQSQLAFQWDDHFRKDPKDA